MAPGEPSLDDYLADPLSRIARAERRSLLIASATGLLVAKVGLVPTRFSTFGLEFQQPEQRALISLVVVTIAYFALAFVLYGITDFFIWREKYQHYLESIARIGSNWDQEDQRAYDELHASLPDIAWLYRWSKPAAFGRIFFEFIVPVLVALYTAISLLQRLRNL